MVGKQRANTVGSSGRWLKGCLRLIFWPLFLLLAILVVLLVVGLKQLSNAGVFIDWQGVSVERNGLALERLQINYQNSQLVLQNLHLSWLYQAYPLQRLKIEQLTGRLADDGWTVDASPASEQPSWRRWLGYLPKQLEVQQLEVEALAWAKLQGQVMLAAKEDLYHPYALQAELTVSKINPQLLAAVPKEFRPTQVQITLVKQDADTPDAVKPLTASAFALVAEVQGATQAQLEGVLNLEESPWRAELNQAQLKLQLPRWRSDGVKLQQLELQLQPLLAMTEQQGQLRLSKGSKALIKQLQVDDLQLTSMQADLSQLHLQWRLPSTGEAIVQLDSPLKLNARQVAYPGLSKQAWNVAGHLGGELPRLNIEAQIKGAQGLAGQFNGRYQNQALTGKFSVAEMFFRGGNPIQQLVPSYWPEWLIVNSGRLAALGDLAWRPSSGLLMNFTANASGLSGEFNRSVLNGLAFQLTGRLAKQQLTLDVADLQVKDLDPGVPLGPIRVQQLKVEVPLANTEATRLRWQQANTGLLKGQVSVAGGDFRFNQTNRFNAEVKGLDIQELLRVYPAEGLQGTGILDGRLPFYFDLNQQHFAVDDGFIKARGPGYLRFDNDKIKAMGQSNQAMRIVTDALEDFHYDLLSGQVNYNETGQLLLNLRLEGRNPDLQKGRPIHFNINLEEDIPALLASLQLSGKVSDTIQQRVRERLENRARK